LCAEPLGHFGFAKGHFDLRTTIRKAKSCHKTCPLVHPKLSKLTQA